MDKLDIKHLKNKSIGHKHELYILPIKNNPYLVMKMQAWSDLTLPLTDCIDFVLCRFSKGVLILV